MRCSKFQSMGARRHLMKPQPGTVSTSYHTCTSTSWSHCLARSRKRLRVRVAHSLTSGVNTSCHSTKYSCTKQVRPASIHESRTEHSAPSMSTWHVYVCIYVTCMLAFNNLCMCAQSSEWNIRRNHHPSGIRVLRTHTLFIYLYIYIYIYI